MTNQPTLGLKGERSGSTCDLCDDPVPHSRDVCVECQSERDPLVEAARDLMPPFQRASETSQAAADAIRDSSAVLRVQVLAYLLTRDVGATDQQIQDALEMRPSTERPRRVELVEMGLVRDSGETRETESGREATVWESSNTHTSDGM